MAPYASPSAAFADLEEDDSTLISGSQSPRLPYTILPNASAGSLGSTWTSDSNFYRARSPLPPAPVAHRSHRQRTAFEVQPRPAALDDTYDVVTVTLEPDREYVTSGVKVLGLDVKQCYERCFGRLDCHPEPDVSQSDMRAMHLDALAEFRNGSRIRRVGRSLLRCLPLVKAKTYEEDLDERCRRLPHQVKDEINWVLSNRTTRSAALTGERTPWTVAMMEIQDQHRFAHPEKTKLGSHKFKTWKRESTPNYVAACYRFIIHRAPIGSAPNSRMIPSQDAEDRATRAQAQGRENRHGGEGVGMGVDSMDRQKLENQTRSMTGRERPLGRPWRTEASAWQSRSRTRWADERRESPAHGRSASSRRHHRQSTSRGGGLQETGFAWPASSHSSGRRAPSPSRPRSAWSDTDDTFAPFNGRHAPAPPPSPPPQLRYVLRPHWSPDPILPRAPSPPRSYSPPVEVRSFQRDDATQSWAACRPTWSRRSGSESDDENWAAPSSRPQPNPFAPRARPNWRPDSDSWSAPTVADEDTTCPGPFPAPPTAPTTAAPSPRRSVWTPRPPRPPSPSVASDLSGETGSPPPRRRTRPSLVYTACRLHDPERLVFTLDSVDERSSSPPPRASSPLPPRPAHQHHNIPCVLCAAGNRAASPRHGGAPKAEDELQVVRRGVVFSSTDTGSDDVGEVEVEGDGHANDRTDEPKHHGEGDCPDKACDDL